jgi:F-type H+-transporting ATPase subunit b
LEALGINLGYLIVQILNFAVIFIVLRTWVYKPVIKMLEKRRESIARGLEDARVAAEARANAEKEANQILADAQSKAAGAIREATEKAESAAREVRAGYEAEVAKAREQALAEVEQERTRILGELRGQVAALAIAATQKLIGEAMDEKRQHALLDEFFSGVKAGRVVVLENAELEKNAPVEVTSALPLTESEQKIVSKEVLSVVGGKSEVSFQVNPQILGGLVIRAGDKIVDGSIAGQLENMRQSMR